MSEHREENEMKAARFAVESDAILREAIRHFSAGTDSDSPGLAMGLLMIRTGLGEIAKRAVALGDEELLDICVQLCVVRSPDRNPSEPRAAKARGEDRDA